MDGMQVGMRFETRRGMQKRYQEARMDTHGNRVAREGCDRCPCGCKFWEKDQCVDCGTPVATLLLDPEWVKENRS